MHELRVATEIIAIVEKEMSDRHLNKIEEVGIRLGALSGVDSESLSFGFEAATIDTPLAGTRLRIEYIPVQGNCRSCAKCFEVEEFIFICPYCASTDIEIARGEELDITYLMAE